MTTEKKTTTLALIDVSHILVACYKISENEPVSTAFEYTMREVMRIANNPRFDHVVVAYDEGPYDRCKIYPEYKANREAKPIEFVEIVRKVKAEIKALGIRSWGIKGQEADDIIATCVKHAESAGWETTIYSHDKDLCQLVSAKTHMVSTRTGNVMDIARVHEKFGVGPAQMGMLLALWGDKTDNIPGVPSIGPKTAAKLIKEYGSLSRILTADVPGKLGLALKDHADNAILSLELVLLNDCCSLVWGEIFEELPKEDRLMGPEAFAGDEEEEAAVTESAPDTEQSTRTPTVPPSADPMVAVAPPQRVAPLVQSEPVVVTPRPTAVIPHAGPGLARAPAVETSIELRPGLSMTRQQLRMMTDLANFFHTGGLYQKKFSNSAAIFTVLELGLELGLSPQIALMSFHVVEGKPCPSAQFLIARAEADPNCDWLECTSHDGEHATYETVKRRGSGKALKFTFTMKDAETAGLLKNWPWQAHPKAMLRKQAGSMAARLWYPGACAGLHSVEEMGGVLDDVAA